MSTVSQVINEVADELQDMMESQQHLIDPIRAIELTDKLSFYWGFLDDELKDYVQCARIAIDDELEWKV